jgi:predicted nucleic acid-binding Zn ribbon protein
VSRRARPASTPPVPMINTAPMRHCAYCGQGLQADWTHCPKCGAPVGAR